MNRKLFNYVIGNPPYQEEQLSNDIDSSAKNYAPPVYDKFMEACYQVADKVELIHPARFLFNAGSTTKAWNKKMLEDEHFKVLKYEPDCKKYFQNTDIKGGIAITLRDESKKYGAIKVFSSFSEMNDILLKIRTHPQFESILPIVFSRTSFRFTKKLHEDFPSAKDCLSEGHLLDVSSNIFQRLPFVFHDSIDSNSKSEYIKILGREDNKRTIKYIKREYINSGKNLDKYKVFIPQATGIGAFGEEIGTMELGMPGMAATETFLSLGTFDDEQSAKNAIKYLKTKLARSLRSLLKVTQIGNRPVYEFIPLQDFTENSDIDWSKSVHEIDLQLYAKYGLDEKEIEFIETHVKEMI